MYFISSGLTNYFISSGLTNTIKWSWLQRDLSIHPSFLTINYYYLYPLISRWKLVLGYHQTLLLNGLILNINYKGSSIMCHKIWIKWMIRNVETIQDIHQFCINKKYEYHHRQKNVLRGYSSWKSGLALK